MKFYSFHFSIIIALQKKLCVKRNIPFLCVWVFFLSSSSFFSAIFMKIYMLSYMLFYSFIQCITRRSSFHFFFLNKNILHMLVFPRIFKQSANMCVLGSVFILKKILQCAFLVPLTDFQLLIYVKNHKVVFNFISKQTMFRWFWFRIIALQTFFNLYVIKLNLIQNLN